MTFVIRQTVSICLCFAVMGARAEPQTLSAAIGSAGQGGVRIHVHPETPFAKTEAWIDENVDPEKQPRASIDAIRLIHDSRPVRLRLLSGRNGKLCVIYHNEEQDGQIQGVPKEFSGPEGMRFLITHEIFHCNDGATLDALNGYPATDPSESSGNRVGKTIHDMEVRADVFAAIKHLVNGGSTDLLRVVRDVRLQAWSLGDFVHDSADSLALVIRDAQWLARSNSMDISLLVDRYTRDQLTRDWQAFRAGSLRYAESFSAANGYAFKGNQGAATRDDESIHPWDDVARAWKSIKGRNIVKPF